MVWRSTRVASSTTRYGDPKLEASHSMRVRCIKSNLHIHSNCEAWRRACAMTSKLTAEQVQGEGRDGYGASLVQYNDVGVGVGAREFNC
jgi:hypothetical protein